jgi:hypothetical protein
MSKLEAAVTRLETALEALERAVAPLAQSRARLAELTRERETHIARLAQLEQEARALASVNEDIEGRLDSAIEEIRAVLGH